jgi:hypothetical protein
MEELESKIESRENLAAEKGDSRAEAEDSKNVRRSSEQGFSKEGLEAQKDKARKLDFEKVKRAWPVILERVKNKKISTYALLLECQPCKLENGGLVLEFRASASFHKGEVEKEANQKVLEAALREILGESPQVLCVEGEEKEEQAPGITSEKKNFTKQHAIELLRDSFGAQIIEEQEQI